MLTESGYLPDAGLSTAVFLALRLGRPLLLEGAPGVGKTELAKRLADILDLTLVRLQCYEGIDASQAIYDWDYARQLLAARVHGESAGRSAPIDLYSEEFLVERPVLRAARLGDRALLLIDEVDRADEQLEAFLLELLAEGTVTIPEFGTVASERPPMVVITSNRTRELQDALRRRCLYHWIELPDLQRETAIILSHASEVGEGLALAVAHATARVRELRLAKPPGIAESVDWARALAALDFEALDPRAIDATVGVLAKTVDDVNAVRAAGATILNEDHRQQNRN
jgi:MoxR-like ATPase